MQGKKVAVHNHRVLAPSLRKLPGLTRNLRAHGGVLFPGTVAFGFAYGEPLLPFGFPEGGLVVQGRELVFA